MNNIEKKMKGGAKILNRKKANWVACFFAILLPVLLVTLKSPAKHRGENLNTEISSTLKMSVKAKTIDTIPVINGSVKDEQGNPIGFASVVIKGTGQGTMVDKDGNFSLKLPQGSRFITVSCIGYQMQIVPLIYPYENMQIVLKPLVIDTIFGIVLVAKSKKKKSIPITEEKSNSIKIYPNPLPPYATLNIEWQYPMEDDHSVEIFDLRGTSVQKKFINVTKKTSKISMQLSLKNTGDYLLCIMNTRTHKIFKTQLMVN